MIFAGDIINFLYKNGLDNSSFNEIKVAVDLLKLSSINIIYISLLSVITAILQTINKSFVPVKNLLIASLIKMGITFLLVSDVKFNIYGLVISDIVCFSIALILDLKYLKTQLKINFDFKNFAFNPIVCSIIMISIISLVKLIFNNLITSRLLTLIMFFAGFVCYLILLLLTKAIKREELKLIKK